jgi:hypothetical protein
VIAGVASLTLSRVKAISSVTSDLRLTFTITPSVGTGIHGLYTPSPLVLIVSPSTTTFTLVSLITTSSEENLRVFNTTSSSPDLFGLIVNSANVLSDFFKTVFLALELTLRVP